MGKSITPKVKSKSRGDNPPFPHATGRWAKKVNGRLIYLGKIADDPAGTRAAEIWREQKHAIRAGHRPQLDGGVCQGVTVKELCDRFLTAREAHVATGELAQRSFNDLLATCTRVADILGRTMLVSDLRPDHFAKLRASLAKGRGLVTLSGDVRRVRTLFRWGAESEVLEHPARMGREFKPPSQKSLRVARADRGRRMFEAADVRKLLDSAGVQVKAMILLGVNCGLGNSDCANLRFRHVDLKRGWLDFPRPKTGIDRRCPLWPETIKALKLAIDERPTPKSAADQDHVFITKYGRRWVEDGSRNSPLSHEFGKLLKLLGLTQPGRNFYALRHVLETIGGATRDQPAVDAIIGHAARE